MQEFLRLCGSNKTIKITNSFHNLKEQSKSNFLSSSRDLLQHVINFIAPSDSLDVRQVLFPSNNGEYNGLLTSRQIIFFLDLNKMVYDRQFAAVMSGIAEAYGNAEYWITRRSILSIVAPKINFSVLQVFIPGITYYRFTAARLFAAEAGTGTVLQQPKRVICRFEQPQVEHFIDFIISNYVCTDLPFGQKTLTLSNGTKLHVPDTIRNCNANRIIKQYYQYTSELFPEFPVLHESTLYKILDGCTASTRKAMSGLNYFAVNGSEAFDNILDLINNLNLDIGEHNRLMNNFKRGKQYLKTDYKVNVQRGSRVPDHCIQYALSDQTSNLFSTSCSDHLHDQVCSECSNLAQTLHDIHQALQVSQGKQEDIKRNLYKFDLAYNAIQTWKCHQLRVINQDLGRESIFDIIGEDTVYLNLDFAMK